MKERLTTASLVSKGDFTPCSSQNRTWTSRFIRLFKKTFSINKQGIHSNGQTIRVATYTKYSAIRGFCTTSSACSLHHFLSLLKCLKVTFFVLNNTIIIVTPPRVRDCNGKPAKTALYFGRLRTCSGKPGDGTSKTRRGTSRSFCGAAERPKISYREFLPALIIPNEVRTINRSKTSLLAAIILKLLLASHQQAWSFFPGEFFFLCLVFSQKEVVGTGYESRPWVMF